MYAALCSSLAKSILLQAETEVTAEKKSAGPLAQVTFNLLTTLDDAFSEIFFAKLVQRVGGWPIPVVVPATDIDGSVPDEAARGKLMGYRKSTQSDDTESMAEYMARVAGVMRVYFHVLKIVPRQRPLHRFFQFPRCWTWFARLMGDKRLLETPVAAQLIYSGFHSVCLDLSVLTMRTAALDVLGSHVLEVWGYQWIKMLALIYEGVTVGFAAGKLIGGLGAEGSAARARVQMEIERIVSVPIQSVS